MTPLRDYQARTLEQTRAEYRAGNRSIVIVSPTGSGKTRMGVELVLQHLRRVERCRALWLAHRTELVGQAAARLRAEGVESLAIVQSGACEGPDDARVVVASVETLVARPELSLPGVTMVIPDECHHYVSREWHSVVQRWPDAVRLGLTATPCRSDGTALSGLFDSLVQGPSVQELVDAGHLVPCDVIAPPRHHERGIVGTPLEAYLAHAAGRRAVVFCATVDDAAETAEAFRAAGITAANIDGTTSPRDRAAALAAFRAGQISVLTNVYVLTEGWDAPEAEVCILARGCTHVGTYLQIVGRVLRPSAGKTSALLIDLRGAVHVHGLPSDPRVFSLDGKPIKKDKTLVQLRQCSTCGATYRAGPRACVRCGTELPKPRRPRVQSGELGRVTVVATPDAKASYLTHLRSRAAARGYKPGWVGIQFKARFGHWPQRVA